jgi:hypothetical protein
VAHPSWFRSLIRLGHEVEDRSHFAYRVDGVDELHYMNAGESLVVRELQPVAEKFDPKLLLVRTHDGFPVSDLHAEQARHPEVVPSRHAQPAHLPRDASPRATVAYCEKLMPEDVEITFVN